jgi:ElaB/YqjD/DUF883 family membrane-anchored ribosome-binding protein
MSTEYPSGLPDNETSGAGTMGNAGMYGAGVRSPDDAPYESGEQMRDELSNLKADLDALMARASSLSDTELREARDRLMERIEDWRHSARGFADQASEQFYHGMDVTTEYVKEKPLQSVAIAAGVGLLLGALMRR